MRRGTDEYVSLMLIVCREAKMRALSGTLLVLFDCSRNLRMLARRQIIKGNDLATILPLVGCPEYGSARVLLNSAFFSPKSEWSNLDASFAGLPRVRLGRHRGFRSVCRLLARFTVELIGVALLMDSFASVIGVEVNC
jgi:hypothetical protein